MTFSQWVQWADQQMWGPGMLVLLMGTGIYLTVRTRFLPWRNLGYALRSALGREARVSSGGKRAYAPRGRKHDAENGPAPFRRRPGGQLSI